MFPVDLTNPAVVVDPITGTDAAMTSTAQQTVAAQNVPKPEPAKPDPKRKKINDELKNSIEVCKNYRKKLILNWNTSADYRRGKPFSSSSDEHQISVNLDWPMVKAKQAALFSQMPKVRISHEPETQNPNFPKFERRLNDLLVEAGLESAMDECLPDVINAAGIAAVLVSCEHIQEDKEVPVNDPSTLPPNFQMELMQNGTVGGQPLEMTTVPEIIDKRYLVDRLSPSDLLWRVNFIRSNFDKAPFIGHTGRCTWAEAVQRFKLTEEDKDSCVGEDKPPHERITHDTERESADQDKEVSFDEIFYKDFCYDPMARSYSAIRHLVFVTGKKDPVIDEPWAGQRIAEDGTLTGALKFPIRVLTLDYMTDEAIPPSASAIGRPQINEINAGRTQMILQRQRSLPVRWFNVNLLDPAIQHSLMRGVWQSMIPVQGDGARALGEISRAQMPTENFLFYKTAKEDYHEMTNMGPTSQQIAEAKGDPSQNQTPYNTQIGRERAKVTSFVVGIAEVLGGLMCLYESPEQFGEGFNPAVGNILKYAILADSTVLLDSVQKLARLHDFINDYATSGFIDIEPLIKEAATLAGFDPNLVVKKPEPKPPVEPNISLRLTGVEDLLNPLALAMLIKSGQAPPPEMIEEAKKLIQQSVVPPFAPVMAPPGSPGQQLFMGAPGDPNVGPAGAPLPPPVPGPPPGTPLPEPAPPMPGEANPQMVALRKVNKTSEPGGKQ